MTKDEKLQERFERNYANMERVLDRQGKILNKQNEILEQLKILPEIMKGVESLYRIGVYFKTMMETVQMLDAKMDAVLARLEPRQVTYLTERSGEVDPFASQSVLPSELRLDPDLAKGRVGKKYMVNGHGPYILGGIKRRIIKHEGVETTAGFNFTFYKKDNPVLDEDLIDIVDEESQIERIE